jgi:EAL domain-containing protein (putative c-di-GMP-specific phosphodiesterase class I)/GGDEF domain-containing protein
MQIEKWKEILQRIDYAFQPIVNIHNGVCIGYEALLRNHESAGFPTIHSIFDSAFEEQILLEIDKRFRAKAFKKFCTLENASNYKFFYNVDNRILLIPNFISKCSIPDCEGMSFEPSNLCFEISEKHQYSSLIFAKSILTLFKQQGFKIAIDNFGAGYSGLQILYYSKPDYLKIDISFINELAKYTKKKLFVSKVIDLAHLMGITVIAEGVETEDEFYACKEICTDFIQGYLIQKPTTQIEKLKPKYEYVNQLNRRNIFTCSDDSRYFFSKIKKIDPIKYGQYSLVNLIKLLIETKTNLLPVVNQQDEPLGIIRENEIKQFINTETGQQLLKNKDSKVSLEKFIIKAPISEITTTIDSIIEIITTATEPEGVILTESGKYRGFLFSGSLLKAINDKKIALSKEENPLTKLPGPKRINEYISQSIQKKDKAFAIVYFDFDDFTAFNNKFGFQDGNRAIIIFADILREISESRKVFIGHVSGDKFFSVFETESEQFDEIPEIINSILWRFKNEMVSIYKGKFIGKTSTSSTKTPPILTASAVILYLPKGERLFTFEDIVPSIANLKWKAKQTDSKIITSYIGEITEERSEFPDFIKFTSPDDTENLD